MLFTPGDDQVIESADQGEGPVDALLRLAESARLYSSTDGRLHARVPVGDRYEIYGLKSSGFRDWLTKGYFVDRREPPSQWAIRRVVSVLEAGARFDGGTPSVFIRVGRDQDGDGNVSTYFLDLGDPSGKAIQIRADGWTVVDRPAVVAQPRRAAEPKGRSSGGKRAGREPRAIDKTRPSSPTRRPSPTRSACRPPASCPEGGECRSGPRGCRRRCPSPTLRGTATGMYP